MRFRGLDLNLLVAFEALLEERSVSRAAARMNLSQPAMSAALARLRSYFGDDILVPQGKRMHATAFAEGLLPQVRESLQGLESLVSTSPGFNPTQSQRSFSLIASDYITSTVLVPLVTRLAVLAPRLRLDLLATTDQAAQQLDEGKVDLLITPAAYCAAGHPTELLFAEDHVVAGWAKNPLFRRKLTSSEILAAGHVVVRLGNSRTVAFADRQLDLLGYQRRVEITVASFTLVPQLLAGTPRLSLMHKRLAKIMAKQWPIAYRPLPFAFPSMPEMLQYHRARAPDEGLTWLRMQIAAVANAESST